MNEKPFQSIEQQLQLLKGRGLSLSDDAANVLMNEGYYSVVNGYKDPFLDKEATNKTKNDTFYPGTTFDDLYTLFRFDRDLRELTFKHLIRLEARIKTICCYTFAEQHPEGNNYLERNNFTDENEYTSFGLSNFNRNLNKLQQHFLGLINSPRNEAVEHYVNEYSYVPIWVLASALTFGNIEHFFNLMKPNDRNLVCRRIVAASNADAKWHKHLAPIRARRIIDILVKFRNICAHDERLYCAHVDKRNPVNYFDFVSYASDVMTVTETTQFIDDLIDLIAKYTEKSPAMITVVDVMGFDDFKKKIASTLSIVPD